MNKYKKKIDAMQRAQLVLVVICVVAAAVFIVYLLRPIVSSFPLKDECGPIGGSISHSIDDEDSCLNACHAFCQSLKKRFYSASFELKNAACNSCDCSCKE